MDILKFFKCKSKIVKPQHIPKELWEYDYDTIVRSLNSLCLMSFEEKKAKYFILHNYNGYLEGSLNKIEFLLLETLSFKYNNKRPELLSSN